MTDEHPEIQDLLVARGRFETQLIGLGVAPGSSAEAVVPLPPGVSTMREASSAAVQANRAYETL